MCEYHKEKWRRNAIKLFIEHRTKTGFVYMRELLARESANLRPYNVLDMRSARGSGTYGMARQTRPFMFIRAFEQICNYSSCTTG